MLRNYSNHIPDRSRPGSTTTVLAVGAQQDGGGKSMTGEQKMKLSKEICTIGTWNVRMLYQEGKLEELLIEMKRYEWTILGMAEMRWIQHGEYRTEEGHKIWYKGEDKNHVNGVGFMVHKDFVSSVLNCEPVSSRIIKISLKARPFNVSIIKVYTPSSEHPDQEIEDFYQQLNETIKKIPRRDILVIQGDWNAKIGPDAHQNWTETVGKHGLGDTNERGLRLLEFPEMNHLVVANTLHPHKVSRRVTWTSSDGRAKNQIDYILVGKRFRSSIIKNKTRSFPGADVGSDHHLVMMGFKLKLKRIPKKKPARIKYNVQNLKDPTIRRQFEVTIGGRFAPLMQLGDVEAMTEGFTRVCNETAMKVLGKEKRVIKPWSSQELIKKCDDRRQLKAKKNDSREDALKYRMANKAVKAEIKKAKEKWIEDRCKDIQDGFERNNTRKSFESLKKITTQATNKASV